MSEARGPGEGSRWVRVDGTIRFLDSPNSRLGLEVDLSRLPWNLFDALGRRVTLLVPAGESDSGEGFGWEGHLARALRLVEREAERSLALAPEAGVESLEMPSARQAWEWLHTHLLRTLANGSPAQPPVEAPSAPPAPSPPDAERAVSVLGYALEALPSMPLRMWEESVTSLHPGAPTREEALRTLVRLSRYLEEPVDHRGNGGGNAPASTLPARDVPLPPASPARGPTEGTEEEMSYDQARGFDEGYRLGRSIGRALRGSPGKGPTR